MKKIIYGIVIILLIGIMLISSYFIFKDKQEDKKQESTFEDLIEIVNKFNEECGKEKSQAHNKIVNEVFKEEK